jgi:hypothetical protein
MAAVNLERTGKEFYQTVEAYLDRLYYNGQSCQLEECPESSLVGQHYQLTSPLASLVWEDARCWVNTARWSFPRLKPKKPAYTEFVEVSVDVGYFKVQHSGEIKTAYAGFTQKQRAESWGKWLAVRHEVASGFEVRLAKHLPLSGN